MTNRKPFHDSLTQLGLLELREIKGSHDLGNQDWRIQKIQDPDYAWQITRLADNAVRKCSSLAECVRGRYIPRRGRRAGR